MAMDIRPASALRTEYNELAARSRMTGQPIYITRNGEGDTVLMDLAAYTRREEELDRKEAALAHRAVVLEAELKRLNGAATYTSAQVRDLVRAKSEQQAETEKWMNFKLSIPPEAMQDTLGISDYYFDKVGESAALRAVDALQNHIDKLMRFPRMGRRTSRRILESIELLQAGP